MTTPGNGTNSQRAQLGGRIRDGLELWRQRVVS